MDYYGNDKVYVGTWPWSFDFDWWKYRNRPKIEESSLEYITQYSEYITDVSIKKILGLEQLMEIKPHGYN